MQAFQDVFISYGRGDSLAFAAKLNRHLVDRGLNVWFDFDDIPVGVDYQQQIDDGIERSDNVIFIISPHAVNSPYCLKEIELALKRNKRIIPLLHVEQISRETWQARNPSGTEADWADYQARGLHDHFQNMHPEIRKINWVLFREGRDDFDAALQKLLDLFARHKEYVQQHTRLLIKALEWEQQQRRSQYLLVGEERLQAEAWLKTRFKDSQPPCLPTDLHCELITESLKNAENLMTQVFLAYADADRDTAQKIRSSLMREGFTVWISSSDIRMGVDFQTAIDRGIEEADNLVYLMSPAFVQSDYCQQEIAYALSLHKRLVPILVEPVSPEQMPVALRQLQYVDLTDNVRETDYQQDASQLIRVLRENAAYHEAHKILLAKALKWQRQHQNPTFLLRGYNLRHTEAWLKVAHKTPAYPPTPLQEAFIAASLQQPPGVSLDVFISYSRVDSGMARQLNEQLQIHGKRTWFDQESIAAGTADFQAEIHRGIESADHFLFILSPNSVNSPYCADEVEYAARLNKRFVTVLHRPIDTATLHPELAKVQWLDFSRPDRDDAANFQTLLRVLDTDAEHLQVHTRLLVRAIEWENRGRNDSFLLRGDDLDEAADWLVQGEAKQPPPTDLHRAYISTSRTVEQAQQILLKAGQTAKRRLLLSSVAMGVMLLVAAGSAFVAKQQISQANQQTQQAKAEKDKAQQETEQAKAEKDKAQQQTQQAKGEKDKAQQEKDKAQQEKEQAKQQKDQAEQAKQQADQQAKRAVTQKDQAEQQAKLARQEQAKANAAVQLAVAKQKEAQDSTRLERAGVAALEQFKFQQTEALVAALQTAIELKTLNGKGKALQDYLAASPLLALQTILDNRQETRLEGHQGAVSSVVFSPDGSKLATSGKDGTARIWDTTGRQLTELKGHQGPVWSVVFSADGSKLATRGEDGTARIWDTTGRQLTELKGHQGLVWSVVFSADGSKLATSGDDGTARIWDTTGRQLAELKGHQGGVSSVVFSSDGSKLATRGDDGTARLWDTTGRQLAELKGHQGLVYSLEFSPDGSKLATSGVDGTARIWDTAGRQLAELKGPQGLVWSVVFSPDGSRLATSGDDGTARIWDTTGRQLTELKGHQGRVWSVEFSPDGSKLATSGDDGTARIWDTTGRQLTELKGHQGGVSSVEFSPDGSKLATRGVDGTARLWDTTGRQLAELKGHQGLVYSLEFSPDGSKLATSGVDGTARIWDTAGRQLAELKGHQGAVYSVVFSPDGSKLATSGDDGTARIWDTTGRQLVELKGHQGGVWSVVFSADGSKLATRGDDGTARIWDTTGRQLTELKGHQGGVSSVVFSSDGSKLATRGDDGTARIWDTTGRQLAELKGHQGLVYSVVFSSDGSKLATRGDDGTARIWDTTGRQLTELKGHQGGVSSVVFSADGSKLATRGDDGTTRIWDIAGRQLVELKGHQGLVYSVVFSPDGSKLATSGEDGTTRIWDIAGRQIAQYQGRGVASPNWRQIATITPPDALKQVEGVKGDLVKIWPIDDLDGLINRGCQALQYYLKQRSGLSDETRRLCDNVAKP